ncbi:MAG: substrate-binding domain-containing protein [Candidatus Bathyarchaeota archaeon]|nr:substrate-binding domain-containing protein [Candidatus Bathyarchaeota archaeon]
MNTTRIAAIAVIVIIIAAIGAYAYTQTGQEPAASPSPTPTPEATPTPTPSPVTLTISSTTSLYETGVENDAIKPAFEAAYPWITVNFLGQGTGAAIQTAMRGDADMIMVHSPSQERAFLEDGYGVNRKIIAYNFFVIVGPEGDPAGISGMSPTDALTTIMDLGEQGEATWVSRGDGSGTHSKEKSLWAAAGIDWETIHTETSWYLETGSGMTATLRVAYEEDGYTLTDLATFLTNLNSGNIEMEIAVEASKDLLNVYSVIADNPLNENLTDTNYEASMLFIEWIVSDEAQQIFEDYGTETFGKPLFSPYMPLLNGSNDTLLSWIEDFAFFDGTECPAQYRHNPGNLYNNPAAIATIPANEK